MPMGEDGTQHRATVISVEGEYDPKSLLDDKDLMMKIKFDHKELDELITYNQLLAIADKDPTFKDEVFWNIDKIVAHRGPISSNDKEYKGSKWNLMVKWTDGTVTSEPLRRMFQDYPEGVIEYGHRKGLLKEEGWGNVKKLARRAKIATRRINQAKRKAFRRNPVYMFGVLVPRNHSQAMQLDEKNGNNKWREAEKLELQQVIDYKTFDNRGRGARIPQGYKKITLHFVYAVKHDGRHKARLVAGGHLTDTPIESTYSSVVSLDGVRTITFLSELNKLKLWATDIGNAYLESYTREKVCVQAGKEFESIPELVGCLLIILKALYGLKSSGLRWHEVLADVLKVMGWLPSYAEPDIWMRMDTARQVWEYLATYVDDLYLAANEPEKIVEALKDQHKFALKGTGPVSFHLGVNYFRDSNNTLCCDAKKYMEKILQGFVRIFGHKPDTKIKSPLERGDHPELDKTDLLEDDGVKLYQSLIGSLQWAVQIGRFDIATAVMTMSSFRALPRKGHLDRLKRIFGYLSRMKNAVLRIRTEEPDYSNLTSVSASWDHTPYAGVEEPIPHKIPRALGLRVTISVWFDANLLHCLITGKAVTGIIVFYNGTPVRWYTKKQATVATSTFAAEYDAGRTMVELVQAERNYLRYLGVPINEVSYAFGDNKSMIDGSVSPTGKLHKRHVALSYHRVREACAAGWLRLFHIDGTENKADILSKHWSYSQIWPILKPILFYEGDAEGVSERSTPEVPTPPTVSSRTPTAQQ